MLFNQIRFLHGFCADADEVLVVSLDEQVEDHNEKDISNFVSHSCPCRSLFCVMLFYSFFQIIGVNSNFLFRPRYLVDLLLLRVMNY